MDHNNKGNYAMGYSLGKGEVESSILSSSTTIPLYLLGMLPSVRFRLSRRTGREHTCRYGKELANTDTPDLLIKSQRRVTAFLRDINRLAGADLHGFARSGGSSQNCGVV